jgi:hypothetical protein
VRDGIKRAYRVEWTGTALNLYVNGTLVSTAALTSVGTATQPFYIGSCPYGVANSQNSDATIYGPVVASENGTPMLTWPLTDGIGSPTAVETINGYNLTLVSSVAWLTPAGAVAGVYGYEVAPSPLAVSAVVFPSQQTTAWVDPEGTTQEITYNTIHTVPIGGGSPFTVKGQAYLATYVLAFASGPPVTFSYLLVAI